MNVAHERLPDWSDAAGSALLTDLYQLTMLKSYVDEDMHQSAVFELFVRGLPEGRNFLVVAGLEQALDWLERARFTAAELAWLRAGGRFGDAFIDWLAHWRFTGDVDALPEGTLCFADEPLLRVVAPISQAQLVESRLINLIQLPTLVASKAVRCVLAAEGRAVVDFGLRRAHGAEAGLLSARAGYIAGYAGTATVLAGMLWNIPLFGTMAHSYVQAHDSEAQAFEHYARAHPGRTTLLIDTYDTERGAQTAAAVDRALIAAGLGVQGVRIDSGDLGAHARAVRAVLDDAGLAQVHIVASGNLDEERIAALVREGAPIDSFGVGTRVNASVDQPVLETVYKLQEYAGRARRKRSTAKATWPGRKQVWRRSGEDGCFCADLIGLDDEVQPGQALLEPVMRAGRRLAPSPALEHVRAHAADQIARLPARLRRLAPAAYPVEVSEPLRRLAAHCDVHPH